MNCLLCQESLTEKISFLDLLTIRQNQKTLCPTCQAGFEAISDNHCPSCFKSHQDTVCSDCLIWKEKGETISHESIYQYNQAMKDYMSRFKFMGDYLLKDVFKQDLKKALKAYKDFQVVPIPMDKENQKLRGFNQVEALLEAAGIPYLSLFEKEKVIKQSSKSRKERLVSKNPFQLRKDLPKLDKVIIVDDVYTTGATLLHAKTLLQEAGCSKVLTFSLAR
ncbi:ComF family protein [Streptococcus loxodontisalivarius]|uniref:Competence protein ComFC n=1 Tax=Streptococcus loxodontisalivarius TaxID=1349415 RepID=A0ABS2PQ82_9STRE|nr:ComF family protein [Streptococcus loxodontisalivarius]MBM7642211.1 competence protein ComFC [Streptococcus loxodontisalivarius]